MDRRNFIGLSAAALAATTVQASGASAMMGKEKAEKGLKIRFLGTGAADWNGKDERGEQRRLSSILVENHILVDFTATAADMIPKDVHPDTIFYTHSHGDHYNPKAAIEVGVKTAYMSQTWYNIACHDFEAAARELGKPMPKLIPVCIGQQIEVAGVTFTPLPANHATEYILEQAQIYLMEKDGARVLYATDTGGLMAVATRMIGIDSHKKGQPITGLIMEATMGMDFEMDYRLFCHSSVAVVKRSAEILTQTKRYAPKEGQPVYLTHMARTLHGTQAELDKTLPAPLKAAYDGLEVLF